MNAPSYIGFRLATLVFGIVLVAQCIWLLLAELSRPGIDRLPTDAPAATLAARQRDAAAWAARMGMIRGDLWAESSFTYADLLWRDGGAEPESTRSLEQVRAAREHAAGYAPHQASAWLLMAGLASRFQWSKPDPAETLKMSYYTGSSELPLAPLRLLVWARSDLLGDSDLQQFVGRDLRLLFAHQLTSAVAEAYEVASPAGKRFIEQAVRDIDPSFLGSLRPGVQAP
jgi:hypothetical protein